VTHLPPPNPLPDLYRRLDEMASQINELMRRRLDFPTDVPVPDCLGCICQGTAVGVSSGNTTVNLASGGAIAQPFNISRVVDCGQGGAALGSDSSSLVALAPALWVVSYRASYTHSGAGLRSAKMQIQNPPQVTTPYFSNVAGVPETAATEGLVDSGCFATYMYPGDYLSFSTTGYAAAGTYDLTLSQHVAVVHQFPYDGF